MKAVLSAVVAALCCTATAQGNMIRVYLEYIEVPHALLTEVMASEHAKSDPALHARMRELVKEKRAKILESCVLVARPGQKATLESIREYIYPVEDYPDDFPAALTPEQQAAQFEAAMKRWARMARPTVPPAFETRNLGVTLEIEPNVGADAALIDLRILPEIVNYLRLDEWVEHKDQWGDASMRRPAFESLRISTGTVLQEGEFGMLGVLTPTKREGGLMTERKLMLFVRAALLRIDYGEEDGE